MSTPALRGHGVRDSPTPSPRASRRKVLIDDSASSSGSRSPRSRTPTQQRPDGTLLQSHLPSGRRSPSLLVEDRALQVRDEDDPSADVGVGRAGGATPPAIRSSSRPPSFKGSKLGTSSATLRATLHFADAAHAVDDPTPPARGAPPFRRFEEAADPPSPDRSGRGTPTSFVAVEVSIRDAAQKPPGRFSLATSGFTFVPAFPELKSLFDGVARAGALTLREVAALRAQLSLRVLEIDGRRALVLLVPPDSVQLNSAPPASLRAQRPEPVRSEQDAWGEPLRSLLWGCAPWLFGARSPLRLLKLWFALNGQPARPIALMDASTLDDRAHRLRHRVRNGEGLVDDRWAFVHGNGQEWWWHSALETTVLVFDVFRTPHACFMLPCEDLVETLATRIDASDYSPLLTLPLPKRCPSPIAATLHRLSAARGPDDLDEALRSATRRTIELRAVVLFLPSRARLAAAVGVAIAAAVVVARRRR